MKYQIWYRTECKLLLRDPVVWIFCAAFLGCLFYATLVSVERQAAYRAAVTSAFETQALQQAEQFADLAAFEAGEKQYDVLFGTPRSYFTWADSVTGFAFSDWSFLATGSSDLFAPVNLVNFYEPPKLFAQDLANPLPRLLGSFDPAFVLVYLLPLFLIALNYRLIGYERERGMLTLLLAQTPAIKSLMVLRMALRLGLVFAFVALALLAAFGVAGVNPLVQSGSLIVLLSLVLLYLLFWFCVVLLVNLMRWTASTCALVLLTTWAFLLMILPTLAILTAASIAEVPSRVSLVNAQRSAAKQASEQKTELFDQYLLDHPELADLKSDEHASFSGTFAWYQQSAVVYETAARAVASQNERYQEQLRARHQLESYLSLASPAVVFKHALETLAGTSVTHYWDYAEALERYAQDWRTFFKRKAFSEMAMTTRDQASLPGFQPTQAQFPAQTMQALLLLGVACVLLGVALFVKQLKAI